MSEEKQERYYIEEQPHTSGEGKVYYVIDGLPEEGCEKVLCSTDCEDFAKEVLAWRRTINSATGSGDTEFARKELLQNISEVIAFNYGKDPYAMAEQVVSLLFNFKGRVIRLLNPSPATQSEQENEA